MNKRESVVLAAGIFLLQIIPEGVILLIEMQNCARRIFRVAGIFPMYVSVKLECVAVAFEHIVEQSSVPVPHGFHQFSGVEIVDR